MNRTHPHPGDTARALRLLTDEMRTEAVPEPAWDDVERRLMERIARKQPPRWAVAAPPASVLPRLLGFVAAAAAVTLLLTSGGQRSTPAVAATQRSVVDVAALPLAPGFGQLPDLPGTVADRDLGALAKGDVVEAGDLPVAFAQAGSVRWTLTPGSRARIATAGVNGVGHVVALERGTVRAEVVPRAASEGMVEAFAVEAAGTRVAVHGTLFSVTLEHDAVLVDVEHGAVAIGPTGHAGVTTGRLLVGPARAIFSLDGGRTARFLPREGASDTSGASGVAAVAVAAPPGAPSALGAAPAVGAALDPAASGAPLDPASSGASLDAGAVTTPPLAHPAGRPGAAVPHDHAGGATANAAERQAAAAATLSETQVAARVNRCIADRQHARTDGVVVSVSSTLEVAVRDDGSVQSLRFDPPVRADLQDCAQSIWGGRFGEGQRTLRVPISFASR